MRRALLIAATAGLALTLTACGENAPTVYKQGQYQGKPDKQPWDNAMFNGDRAGWEQAIKARNNGQDEYARSASN